MQRTTITLDDELAADLEAWLDAHGAQSRSEAIRDLLRRGLAARAEPPEGAECYGVVSYVADLSTRNLAARLPQGRLDRHDQTVAALSVPLDHRHSVEVAVMRGDARAVTGYAEALFLERGIMHGTLGMIPVARDDAAHVHDAPAAEAEPHSHGHHHAEEEEQHAHAHHHMRVLASF
uniref:nickel-responsive transcriptional regulator NikR n=1 Tax=Paenirhodobacter enshiensis TaxID=1105367 RepID=UPI0035B21247